MAVVNVLDEAATPVVPLTLIAGFLGAGKTTLLNRLLQGDHGLRLGVLVNDFGDIDIDAELIARVDGETITLHNGCICCTMVDDMLLSLFKLLSRDDPPEHVLIEASGVSDPNGVLRAFDDARWLHLVRMDSVITVLDAEQFGTIEYSAQPLALHQLLCADLVVVSKTDLADDETLVGLRQKIRGTVPHARVIESVHGRVPVEVLLASGRFDPLRLPEREPLEVHVHGAESQRLPHSGPGFDTWSFRSDRPLDPTRLRAAIDAWPAEVFRAKGVFAVAEDERRHVLQVVGRRAEVTAGEPWGDEPPGSRIVLIGAPGGLDPVALRAQLDRCEVGPGTLASGGRALMRWIRRVFEA